jgi:hypothetical protein
MGSCCSVASSAVSPARTVANHSTSACADPSLAAALRRDVRRSLELAEQLLVPQTGGTFDSYARDAISRAYSGCCSCRIDVADIAFMCHDCLRFESGCLCASCFLQADHSGHRVQVLQGMTGLCDCGNLRWSGRAGRARGTRARARTPTSASCRPAR